MAANPVAVSDTTGRPQTKPLLPSKSKLNWGTVDLQKQAKKEEKEKQKRVQFLGLGWFYDLFYLHDIESRGDPKDMGATSRTGQRGKTC